MELRTKVNWPKISIDPEKDFDQCFACGKNNPIGLKLSFTWDGKTVRAEFIPRKFFQGWSGIVHGGILACLLDEAMVYASHFEGIKTVTAKMQVRIKHLAMVNRLLVVTASITKRTRKLIETAAKISLKDGTPIAEGTATMFVFNSVNGNHEEAL